jgi:hypothetical protein
MMLGHVRYGQGLKVLESATDTMWKSTAEWCYQVNISWYGNLTYPFLNLDIGISKPVIWLLRIMVMIPKNHHDNLWGLFLFLITAQHGYISNFHTSHKSVLDPISGPCRCGSSKKYPIHWCEIFNKRPIPDWYVQEMIPDQHWLVHTAPLQHAKKERLVVASKW